MSSRPDLPRVIQPAGWDAPRGYSNGMLAPEGGRLLCVAGQIGWDAEQRLVGDLFSDQYEQALANVVAVVREAGGGPEHLLRLTTYVVDRHEYTAQLARVGEAYRNLIGRHYPAMALVEVSALLEPGAKVEIEGTAMIPSAAADGQD